MATKMTVVVDSREQLQFDLRHEKYVEDVSIKKLNTGDYSVAGLENVVTVERKSLADLGSCIFSRRFSAELDRMQTFTEAHVVLCFSLSDLVRYPYNLGLPDRVLSKIKVRGNVILKKIMEFQQSHPWVRWHFVESQEIAAQYTLMLLLTAYRKYGADN